MVCGGESCVDVHGTGVTMGLSGGPNHGRHGYRLDRRFLIMACGLDGGPFRHFNNQKSIRMLLLAFEIPLAMNHDSMVTANQPGLLRDWDHGCGVVSTR